MIRGIQSNVINGIIWFIIKPNYFISINDQNISPSNKFNKTEN